ncbi:MAG: thioether cross-link-forming SCIFF peptide maturase [Clostridium sp.]|jgi:uncharacterized protein|nr:thioether cross-link-forming SCIFF peptide maturase [Clostridium sp.]
MNHRFQSLDKNFVLDVDSGAIHVVDEVVYRILPIIEPVINDILSISDNENGLSQIPQELFVRLQDLANERGECLPDTSVLSEAITEILSLVKAGLLFSQESYQEVVTDFVNRQTVTKALCLHVSHDCNLACRYCFAKEGEYHGERGMMSEQVGKAAIDYLIAHSGNRINLEVDFFGGEPLMNFELVKELVAYGRSKEKEYNKRFRFTLTTNGVLLTDEVMAFCNQEISNMVFSLDGRKEVHDRMRPFRGGQGSFDVVLPKIRRAVEQRGNLDYYVRGTFTKQNLDFAADVLALADMGFSRISVEPVVGDETDPYAITKENIPFLCEQYDILLTEMIKRRAQGNDFGFFHFQLDLSGGPCVAKRLAGCGSGTEYLAVTPWGDLYPCHQFVGEESYLMGNVWNGVLRSDLQESFHRCNVFEKEACKSCFAKYYCSGGCAANAVHYGKDAQGVYEIGCVLMKKRVECAIALYCSDLCDTLP